MGSNYEDVAAFNTKFDLSTKVGPQPWDDTLIEFRARFLQEELDEFNEGVEEHDHAKMADALIDLVYVALGTALVLGYPWQALWDDVQRANMSKERAARDGSNSARGSAWDVVKPEGWRPPETEVELSRHGFEMQHCAQCGITLVTVDAYRIISRVWAGAVLRFCTIDHHDLYFMPENFSEPE